MIDIEEYDIKMKVNEEQYKEIQKICYDLGIYWRATVGGEFPKRMDYLVINQGCLLYTLGEEDFIKLQNKEVSAEEFIKTKGFTKEIKDDIILAEPEISKPRPKTLHRIKHQYGNAWLYYCYSEDEYYWSEYVQDADLFDTFQEVLEVIEGQGLEGIIETIYRSSKT